MGKLALVASGLRRRPEAAGVGIWLAVGCLVGSLGLWSVSITVMWRRSLRRSVWAIGWYCSGALFLGLAGLLVAAVSAIEARVRGGFAAPMPAARPRLDGAVAALAMVTITALALAQGTRLGGLHDPARLLLLAVYVVLGTRVAQLAARVVVRARPSI